MYVPSCLLLFSLVPDLFPMIGPLFHVFIYTPSYPVISLSFTVPFKMFFISSILKGHFKWFCPNVRSSRHSGHFLTSKCFKAVNKKIYVYCHATPCTLFNNTAISREYSAFIYRKSSTYSELRLLKEMILCGVK